MVLSPHVGKCTVFRFAWLKFPVMIKVLSDCPLCALFTFLKSSHNTCFVYIVKGCSALRPQLKCTPSVDNAAGTSRLAFPALANSGSTLQMYMNTIPCYHTNTVLLCGSYQKMSLSARMLVNPSCCMAVSGMSSWSHVSVKMKMQLPLCCL